MFVIGGANSAGQAAVYFSGYAGRVTMLIRADSLTKSMSQYLIEQIAAIPNIELRTRSQAVAAEGEDGHLKALRIRGPDGTRRSNRPMRASCSSARLPGPTGSKAWSRATSAGSSLPVPTSEITVGHSP